MMNNKIINNDDFIYLLTLFLQKNKSVKRMNVGFTFTGWQIAFDIDGWMCCADAAMSLIK